VRQRVDDPIDHRLIGSITHPLIGSITTLIGWIGSVTADATIAGPIMQAIHLPDRSGAEEPPAAHRSRASSRAAATGEGFVLRVIAGPDTGRTFEIPASQSTRLIIGQGGSSDIALRDRELARTHAGIDLVDGRLRLSDLGSRSGTRVNGVVVVEAHLEGGERIDVGATALIVERPDRAHEAPLSAALGFGRVVGASVAMRRLYPLCERIAMSNVPVVIQGETGTGKEMLAESLHEMGPRASGPFAVFDCTAVPPNLVESALFGHERGAFTGATETRRGVFEEGHGGTLLIDEIGDLDIELQAKLLRALDRSEVRRIGGKAWIRTDVRVLAATRRDLDQEVATGKFREDLFYRLAVARIELPPLRQRTGDITILARTFWGRLARGEPEPVGFLSRLERYAWPGNVRQLYNAVARRVALGDLGDLQLPATPAHKSAGPPAPVVDEPPPSILTSQADDVTSILAEELPFPRAREKMMNLFERRYFEDVLRRHGGNVGRAAAASGIARRYFQLLQARVKHRTPDE
jgi:DNA-binding NtrC family response regulator